MWRLRGDPSLKLLLCFSAIAAACGWWCSWFISLQTLITRENFYYQSTTGFSIILSYSLNCGSSHSLGTLIEWKLFLLFRLGFGFGSSHSQGTSIKFISYHDRLLISKPEWVNRPTSSYALIVAHRRKIKRKCENIFLS